MEQREDVVLTEEGKMEMEKYGVGDKGRLYSINFTVTKLVILGLE